MRAVVESGDVNVPGKLVKLELTEQEYDELKAQMEKLPAGTGGMIYKLYRALFLVGYPKGE